MNAEYFGSRLAAYRQRRGWSLERLAREAGVTKSCIWEIEQGRCVPTLTTAQKLVAALDTSVGDLLGETESAAGAVSRRDAPHCVLCDDRFREPGEVCWGLRVQRAPGDSLNAIDLCWECAFWLHARLTAHVNSYAYQFVFDRRRRRRPVHFLRTLEESALPVEEAPLEQAAHEGALRER